MAATAAPVRQDPVMALLDHGVPLTLLVDLADQSGPRSQEIYATEVADDRFALASV